MKTYYKNRAFEYEKIYFRDDPVRQREQQKIATAIQKTCKNKHVLEIACGTGYWTQYLSQTARKITATDAVDSMLKIAQEKKYHCPITFQKEDAYRLSFSDHAFEEGLANFWFSHVPKKKINAFLNEFHRVLKKKSPVFFADNVYIPGIGGTLITKPHDENTYKKRVLENGSTHLVLKNYYSSDELTTLFQPYGTIIDLYHGKCFWYITYLLR